MRIYSKRESMKLSQEELCDLMNLSPVRLAGIEIGSILPSLEEAANLCACFHISMDFLIFGRKQECLKPDFQAYSSLIDDTLYLDNPPDFEL